MYSSFFSMQTQYNIIYDYDFFGLDCCKIYNSANKNYHGINKEKLHNINVYNHFKYLYVSYVFNRKSGI